MEKEYQTESENADDLLNLSQYIKNFTIHFELLLRRYKRFREINDIHNTDIDVITYLDIIVVQLRAMCIESKNLKNNYTAQNLLRKVGEDELASKIDAMLDEPFIPETDFSIREAIKTLADKFICHYDNFDWPDIKNYSYYSQTIEKKLKNPYDKQNLDYIMHTLIDCIGEGLTIKMN